MKKLILAFACLAATAYAAQPGPRLEMIEDIDLGFFLSSPKAKWAGDPFERLPGFGPAISENPDSYKLTGILYSDEDPIATINQKNFRIGDTVNARTVTEIGENYVILKRGGSEIELVLPTVSQDWERESRSLAGKESR
jgi:hypothetical protein